MKTTIYVCDTCRQPNTEDETEEKCGCVLFAEKVEFIGTQYPQLNVVRHSCLMGCQRHCTAAIAARGKMSYVLGDFNPDSEDAQALVDYALRHQNSETGIVPYKFWPLGIKGHFISRMPSLGE